MKNAGQKNSVAPIRRDVVEFVALFCVLGLMCGYRALTVDKGWGVPAAVALGEAILLLTLEIYLRCRGIRKSPARKQ
jgi:hypothetical protein